MAILKKKEEIKEETPAIKHAEWPNTSEMQEKDKELWDAEKLKKDDAEFRKEAGFLTRLLRKVKIIK